MLWTKAIPKDRAAEELARRHEAVVEVPDAFVYIAALIGILTDKLGFRKSIEANAGVLGDGTAIPMMSYGLVEYLMGLDLTHCDVLELGGGESTGFWAARTKSVLTFETDPQWAKTLEAKALPGVTVRASTAVTLAADIARLDSRFDIIVVDPSANRHACARAALPRLKPGGFVLLDNSDWYPNTARLLREADLIQVDYPDFRPAHYFRAAASLFLHRDFRPKPRLDRLPLPCIGGKDIGPNNQWDTVTPP
jgi:hypothetical protein